MDARALELAIAHRLRVLTSALSLSTSAEWSGYSGIAYYNGWLSTSLATTATVWVSTCSSFNLGTDVYILDVNGATVTSALAGMAAPDQLTINGNIYVDAEWSNFGVAEFMVRCLARAKDPNIAVNRHSRVRLRRSGTAPSPTRSCGRRRTI